MDFTSIANAILNNQIVTGLSFTAVLGGAAYQLRRLPHLLKQGVLRYFTVEMTVMSSDAAFEWLDRWLAAHPYSQRTRSMALKSLSETANVIRRDDDIQQPAIEWTLTPGHGTHLFWWAGRPLIFRRDLLNKDGMGQKNRTKPLELLHFRTLGMSQATMRNFVADARSLTVNDTTIALFVWNDYHWAKVKGRALRPLDSIVLPDGQAERIVADITWFSRAEAWYRERGIPYRRGYLLVGPPGTGKTSIVLALAAHFKRPICVININSVQSDNDLFQAFLSAPVDAIMLIEDIDCAFSANSREKKDEDRDNGSVSKAGLLNALDGVTTPDGRIVVMTTNFPDTLDPALIRPGRADVHERFDNCGPEEQIRMARRFYDGDFRPLPMAVSPATLQAAFTQFPNDPEKAHVSLLQSVVESSERHNVSDAA